MVMQAAQNLLLGQVQHRLSQMRLVALLHLPQFRPRVLGSDGTENQVKA
jgi:hypothetical protein